MYKQAVYNISQMKLFKNRTFFYIPTYHITHFIHKNTSTVLHYGHKPEAFSLYGLYLDSDTYLSPTCLPCWSPLLSGLSNRSGCFLTQTPTKLAWLPPPGIFPPQLTSTQSLYQHSWISGSLELTLLSSNIVLSLPYTGNNTSS